LANPQQDLATIFNEFFNSIVKRPLDVPSVDRLHKICLRLSIVIAQLSERVALEKSKRLNDAIKESFNLIAADIAKLEDRIKQLESK